MVILFISFPLPSSDNQSQQSATPAPQAATTLAPPLGLGEAEPGAPPQPEIDLRFYNELMDTVPQESASVPLVLHAMLEQVRKHQCL